MKTLLCTALVVLSISVCGAYQAPPAANPAPPSIPGMPNPPPGGTPELPGGPGTIPEQKSVPPIPDRSPQQPSGPNPEDNKGEPLDPSPTVPPMPGKKIE
jgi:protein TonB